MFHPCDRLDCVHNENGRCTFYVGDLYYSICIDTASNYESVNKQKEEVVNSPYKLNDKGEITW